MAALLSKFGGYAVVAAIFMVAGIAVQQKYLAAEIPPCPACPACKCPDPAVSVQPFDFEGKIKGVKTINYSPQFSGSISVAGVDSVGLRRMIERSIEEGFQKYDFKKRRR